MTGLLVMSRFGLADYILTLSQSSITTWPVDGPISDDSFVRHGGDHSFILNRDDTPDGQLVFVSIKAISDVVANGGGVALERLLARVDRVARNVASPPLSLPPQWRKYQHDNLLAFFALPRAFNENSVRWIAEILADRGVCFWTLTSRETETSLARFVPNPQLLRELTAKYSLLLQERAFVLPQRSSPVATRLQSLVDLTAVGSGPITKGRTYSKWVTELTPGQTKVLEHDASEPLKVRGAAGTGKTLVLELKALREVYRAAERGKAVKVLYVTHSWALAEQVDEALHALDETGESARAVDVMPLVTLRELIQGPLPEGVDLLGEDSLEGKKEQLRLISESVDAIRRTDWPTYRDVSTELRRGVEAEPFTPDRARLCFDLMREFIEVMDPNKITPGLNSLNKYLELRRKPWMVDLPTRGSREFVFGVFREYVGRLVEEGQLTTDQALGDFRRYLEGYAWNLRREDEGYDVVLVDEFHLFNDTERYILHLLTNDTDAFPRLIMAMDPRQSPFALLTGLTGDGDGSMRLPGLDIPDPGAIELTSTHRFTPRILDFVSHLHKSFPNLVSLGEDWDIDVAPVGRLAGFNPSVEVKFFAQEDSAVGYALEMALVENTKGETDDRVAVIGVGLHDLDCIVRHLRSFEGKLPVTIIESREDVGLLRYSRRSVVVTTAELAAGLQFSRVLVVSTTNRADAGSSPSSGRITLSQLYLAATRAEDYLLIACVRGDEGIPLILQGAVQGGVAALLK